MARKESKIESFKITLELSAHMFYTIFTMSFEMLYNIVNSLVGNVARHSDKLQSIIPDKTLDWFKKVESETKTREESYKAAKDTVEDVFKNIKNTNNKTQDTVEEKSAEEIKVDKVEVKQEIRQEIKERIAKGQDVGVNNYIDTIVNITIGDVTIQNIENMNSLISTLKDITDRVNKLDYTKMSMEELVDLKDRINNSISNINMKGVKDKDVQIKQTEEISR